MDGVSKVITINVIALLSKLNHHLLVSVAIPSTMFLDVGWLESNDWDVQRLTYLKENPTELAQFPKVYKVSEYNILCRSDLILCDVKNSTSQFLKALCCA